MNNQRYKKDKLLSLYMRKTFSGIAYSDGSEIENHILNIIEASKDLSVYSNELLSNIINWPTEYHFSRQRHVITSPCNIQPGDKVLELGCGCGAITRHLGELDAEVTAVEGSITRAKIAASRCRDLSNVTVICENIDSFITDKKYDWVLLIGVLEYAPLFTKEGSTTESYLEKIGSFIDTNGQIVIAIENKLGLKYFNGCNEDHVNKIFYGVQGLYKEKEPTTYGKLELKKLLSKSGFTSIDFLYPFPDYKLPSVIITENGMLDDDFDVASILLSTYSRDYSGQNYRLFSEKLVYQELSKNNILMDLSNSFLVFASKNTASLLPQNLLGTTFSQQRNAKFSTQTSFIRQGDKIFCEKVRKFLTLPPKAEVEGFRLFQVDTEKEYFQGINLSSIITKNISTSNSNNDVINSFFPWIDYILSISKNSQEDCRLESYFISGEFLDLIPSNIIDTKTGYKIIDQEWKINQDIPLGWLLLRGIVATLNHCIVFEDLRILYIDILTNICTQKDLSVRDESIEKWWILEKKLQKAVTDITINNEFIEFCLIGKPRLEALLAFQEDINDELTKKINLLNSKVSTLMEEKNIMMNSKSWRLTKPLRFLKKLIMQHTSPPNSGQHQNSS